MLHRSLSHQCLTCGWDSLCANAAASAMGKWCSCSMDFATFTSRPNCAIRCISTRRTSGFMPETSSQTGLERILPLKQHLRQGRYGALLSEGPGVRLSIRYPLSIATVIARKDKGQALSVRLTAKYGIEAPDPRRMVKGDRITLQWCADQQYYAVAEDRAEGELYRELRSELEGLASVSDQSHGRVVIVVTGSQARALLAKGSGVDFHRREFPINSAVPTQMAHIGVHVAAPAEDAFELSMFRGFSEHFWEWLTEQAQEFGYQVV